MRRLKPGLKVVLKTPSNPELNEKTATIKQVGLFGVTVSIGRGRGVKLYDVAEEEIVVTTPDSLSGEEKRAIIRALVKPERELTLQDYVVELAQFNRLLKRFPSLDFWRSFNPGFKVFSVIWFLGGGKAELMSAYNAFTLEFKPKAVKTDGVKIGDDIAVVKKPNLRQWLN